MNLTSDELDTLHYAAKLVGSIRLKTRLSTHRIVALMVAAAYNVALNNGSNPDELIADVAALMDAALDDAPPRSAEIVPLRGR